MAKKTRVEAVIHGKNLTAEQRAKYTRRITTMEELVQLFQEGSGGRTLLLKKRDNPDDNALVEYRKTSGNPK